MLSGVQKAQEMTLSLCEMHTWLMGELLKKHSAEFKKYEIPESKSNRQVRQKQGKKLISFQDKLNKIK